MKRQNTNHFSRIIFFFFCISPAYLQSGLTNKIVSSDSADDKSDTRNNRKQSCFLHFFPPLSLPPGILNIQLHSRKSKAPPSKKIQKKKIKKIKAEKMSQLHPATQPVSQPASHRHRHFPNTRMRVSEPQLTRNDLPLSVRHVMESFN